MDIPKSLWLIREQHDKVKKDKAVGVEGREK